MPSAAMPRPTEMVLYVLIIVLYAPGLTYATSFKVPDNIEERVKACTICHEDVDKTGVDAYYPRIAGKPGGYLFNQLRHFRDGQRYYQPMAILLENISDDYLLEIARYFASLQFFYPQPAPHNLPAKEEQAAKKLIEEGDSARNLPACNTCHGEALMGVEPYIPSLLGLPYAYLAAQFGGWRNGGVMRGQTPDCMSEIAKKLTQEEVYVLTAWLPAQQVSGKAAKTDTLDPELIKGCKDLFSDIVLFQ